MLPNSKNLLDCEPRTSRLNGWFDLEDWVGPDRPSHRADIAKIDRVRPILDKSLDRLADDIVRHLRK